MAKGHKELMMGRDYTLRTMSGHTIRFKRMVPKRVPKSVVDEAMRHGAFPPNPEEEAEAQTAEDDARQEKEQEHLGKLEQREETLKAQIRTMIDRNHRDDFTASGRPDVRVIRRETGLDLTAEERDRLHDVVIHEIEGND